MQLPVSSKFIKASDTSSLFISIVIIRQLLIAHMCLSKLNSILYVELELSLIRVVMSCNHYGNQTVIFISL